MQISRDLVVGSVIQVKNKCGAQVSARIVSLLRATHGMSTYGIEFVGKDDQVSNFWGITFPSSAEDGPARRR